MGPNNLKPLAFAALAAMLVLSLVSSIAIADDSEVEQVFEFDELVDVHQLASSEDVQSHMRRRRKHSKKASSSTGFNIALGFSGSITAAEKRGFLDARAKWQTIITKDFAATMCIPAGVTMCGYKFPSSGQTCIDDLFIGVKIREIDGVGKIAGSAGPCTMDDTGKIRTGVMTFDKADAAQLIADGIWETTILHEMGHVLGLGTMWDYKNLVTPRGQPPPYSYLGSNGNDALVKYNGGKGQIVVEDQGGSGTARAHWKEAVYDTELMTGWLERKGIKSPLSAFTVGALADLGYVVDITKADPYTVPGTTGTTPPSLGGRRLHQADSDDDDSYDKDDAYGNSKQKSVKSDDDDSYDKDDAYGHHSTPAVKSSADDDDSYDKDDAYSNSIAKTHKGSLRKKDQSPNAQAVPSDTNPAGQADPDEKKTSDDDPYDKDDAYGANDALVARKLDSEDKFFLGNDVADIPVMLLSETHKNIVTFHPKKGRHHEYKQGQRTFKTRRAHFKAESQDPQQLSA